MTALFVLSASIAAPTAMAGPNQEPQELSNPTGPDGLDPSPPIVIDGRSGVMVHRKRISNPDGPCIVVRNADNITVALSVIGPCGGNAIVLADVSGAVIADSFIHTGRSGADGENTGLGIHLVGGSDILIRGNRIERSESGIYAVQTRDLRVVDNYFLNPLGPFPRGQCVQFDSVFASRITNNVCEARPEKPAARESDVEDNINLYKSSSILVARNYIKGGGSPSGCGILLADASGDENIAEDNVIIRTSQCGIGIAAGNNHVIRRNKILDTSFPGGTGNTAIYVWKQYPGSCAGHTVVDNVVRNKRPDGAHSPFWDGGNCGTVTKSGNLFDWADDGPAAAALLPEIAKLPSPPSPTRLVPPAPRPKP